MKDVFRLISHSPQQTESAGEAIGKRLQNGGVVALFGPMGMGKTVFARGMVKGLGSNDFVSSPTFAIVNEYKSGKGTKIYHFDMYRISGEDDLESTGYYDCIGSKGDAVIIEWSENIVSELPPDAVCVVIKKGQTDSEREITVCMLPELESIKG